MVYNPALPASIENCPRDPSPQLKTAIQGRWENLPEAVLNVNGLSQRRVLESDPFERVASGRMPFVQLWFRRSHRHPKGEQTEFRRLTTEPTWNWFRYRYQWVASSSVHAAVHAILEQDRRTETALREPNTRQEDWGRVAMQNANLMSAKPEPQKKRTSVTDFVTTQFFAGVDQSQNKDALIHLNAPAFYAAMEQVRKL